MTIELLHERDVDDMEIKKLIIAHQKEKVLHALLIAILQADKMQKKMDVGTFNFVGIGIEIGLAIPKMKLKFKRI
jgi:hypothetical protein